MLPDFFNGDRPVDFVYKNRKALESLQVSSNLHAWIDCLFGDRQHDRYRDKSLYQEELYETVWNQLLDESIRHDIDEAGRVPHRLFQSPHPHRLNLNSDIATTFVLKFANECRYAFVQEGGFAVLEDSGNVQIYHIDFTGQSIAAAGVVEPRDLDIIRSLHSKNSSVTDRASEQFLLVASFFNGYYAVSHRNGRIQRVTAPFAITEVAISGNLVVALGVLGIALFVEDRFQFCVRNYTADTVCVFVSESFGLMVFGGTDGLAILDAHSGLMIRRISFDGGVIRKVMITEGFGFVVAVFVDHQQKWFLVVFTVNGVFVRKREISGEVALWKQWTSVKGLDFIVFTTVNGPPSSFTTCEVWALNFFVLQCKNSQSPIIMVNYITQKETFVVCQADGRVNVFYEPHEQLEKSMDDIENDEI
jgi:hypothetical protein